MSRWRDRGFVSDSEEEEDSEIEPYDLKNDDLVERVEVVSRIDGDGEGRAKTIGLAETSAEGTSGTYGPIGVVTLVPSAFDTSSEPERQPTESPDPLQFSPTCKLYSARTCSLVEPAVEILSHSRNSHLNLTTSTPNCNRSIPPFSLIEKSQSTFDNGSAGTEKEELRDLGKFGVFPLSDGSDDELLSDPPTDLESPPASAAASHHQTAVQVVIPPSVSIQHNESDNRVQRDLRQRKPIQVHPYVLEGEMYRREVQSRGLKPVPRHVSPQRQLHGEEIETQERAFDPNRSRSSSPLEYEIAVFENSTQTSKTQTLRRRSSQRPAFRAPTGRRFGKSELRHQVKKRKVGHSETSVALLPVSIFEDDTNIPAPLALLNSPLHSIDSPSDRIRSAPARSNRVRRTYLTQSPPTPSTSSIIHDDITNIPALDSESVPVGTHRSSSSHRRSFTVILSDSDSITTTSSDNSEHGDQELKRVGRKIKGVLPASWLRLDLQRRQKRKKKEFGNEQLQFNVASSPERIEPQRGVAVKVIKHARKLKESSNPSPFSQNIVTISDDSDIESRTPVISYPAIRGQENHMQCANVLAAQLEKRYHGNNSDDLSDMENDRLHLPTLGGTRIKRKRQTKVTDVFEEVKMTRSNVAIKNIDRRTAHSRRNVVYGSRSSRFQRERAPELALSIVDADISPTRMTNVPQFLKVARRQAIRRPDLARQSPRDKQIHLGHVQDTDDANVTLKQWLCGTLLLKDQPRLAPRSQRKLLSDRMGHQQYIASDRHSDRSSFTGVRANNGQHQVRKMRPPQAAHVGLRLFQRQSPGTRRRTKPFVTVSGSVSQPKRHVMEERSLLRIAQLEESEKTYSSFTARKTARSAPYITGPRHGVLPLQSHPHEHWVMTRFLAMNDTELLSQHISRDQERQGRNSPGQNVYREKRNRKFRPERIDIDLREYRQPSEPVFGELLKASALQSIGSNDGASTTALQGLGSNGTRYPITFDIQPLLVGTYFHRSTFIGSGEFRRASSVGGTPNRNMDMPAGHCFITHEEKSLRCGPWDDETFSGIDDMIKMVWEPLEQCLPNPDDVSKLRLSALESTTKCLRSLIEYVALHLSFIDPLDRRDFVVKFYTVLQGLLGHITTTYMATLGDRRVSLHVRKAVQALSYLLVMSCQIYLVAKEISVETTFKDIENIMRTANNMIVAHLLHYGMPELNDFLETNKRHVTRANGAQENDILVESTVICMQTCQHNLLPNFGFWWAVNQELGLELHSSNTIETFERTWASIFIFLPFFDIEISGILSRERQKQLPHDDWTSICQVLKRIFQLYPSTSCKHSSSLNDYVRANLSRCHTLIQYWQWRQPNQVLNAIFDFFRKRELKMLFKEHDTSSVSFLNDFSVSQPLTLLPHESSFHIALKCLALGLQAMKETCDEKTIRSFVIRNTPNHGRSYPKELSLDEESLGALRNHHDLLSTLYCAAPAPCRPKLQLVKDLVSHETSHQEACRLSVRAWSNLTLFQLSSDESSVAAKPFAFWHKEIIHQTLQQYDMAKREADPYLKAANLDSNTQISSVMVRQTMEKNQECCIANMRDCIAGMRRAIHSAHDKNTIGAFLLDADTIHLFKLPHFDDHRLVSIIRDSLSLFRDYIALREPSFLQSSVQQTNGESQDYGDFPNLDDLEESDLDASLSGGTEQSTDSDFLERPLWHLLSNVFGAEVMPDENLLLDCVDTWVLVAKMKVISGERSWDHYIDAFSKLSWQQLRYTEQTRKLRTYYMASLIECDSAAYRAHKDDFMKVLLVSLADRESMLRFQYRLLQSIVHADEWHPLLKNLPFYRNQTDETWDITPNTLKARRLALVSSILSNIRDEVYNVTIGEPARAAESKRSYATLLKDFMTAMKNTYQQMSQGTPTTGAYVEFVQRVVQFLTQYTHEICPVLPYFTDEVSFPLPASDPTYVMGRLSGYAPKVKDTGTVKQLAIFVQTVAQQAAADSKHHYLLNQLITSLCTEEALVVDRAALRATLLCSIFPAYVEASLLSKTGFVIALPILQCLPPLLDAITFDLRIYKVASLESIHRSILSVLLAIVRGTQHLIDQRNVSEQPFAISALKHLLGASTSSLPLLAYISDRTPAYNSSEQLELIAYMRELSSHTSALLRSKNHDYLPTFGGETSASFLDKQSLEILSFCRESLKEAMRTNWTEDAENVRFGQGQVKREVMVHLAPVESEQAMLARVIAAFRCALLQLNIRESNDDEERSFMDDLLV